MNCYFSNHLSNSLDAVLQRSKAPPPVVHVVASVDSPLKRSRTESPTGSSSSPCESPSRDSPSGCKYLRSILCNSAQATPGHGGSTPITSPPSSRPMSRRSSSSCKAVRFARCTNASVFPALSGEEYDRSPIIPSCGADSLQLPQRDNKDDEGWIKCKERQKTADAKKAAGIDPEKANAPWAPHTTGVENPVEGVHGLIEGANGGFFVGDERREADQIELEDLEMSDVVVDDANEDDARPELINDGTDSSDDSDAVLSVTTSIVTTSEAALSSPLTIPPSSSPDTLDDESSVATPTVTTMPDLFASKVNVVAPTARRVSVDDHDAYASAEEVASSASRTSTPPTSCSIDNPSSAESSAAEDDGAQAATKKDRYGICALGKYSRKDVFSTFDSLGGF